MLAQRLAGRKDVPSENESASVCRATVLKLPLYFNIGSTVILNYGNYCIFLYHLWRCQKNPRFISWFHTS